MKLWSKDSTNTSKFTEAFTTGRDKEFDLLLAEYDVLGSLAHAQMLQTVGLLTTEELGQIQRGLEEILQEIRNSTFRIQEDVEDVHSQIELLLTQRIGEAGKKIHSGRSRNDQVAVDIKLYLRTEITQVKQEVKLLFDLLLAQSE